MRNRSIKSYSIIFLLSIFSFACSQTRPYVTSIQPAGVSGIVVEKCETEYNPFTSKVSTTNCSQSYIQIGNGGNTAGTSPVQLNNNVK